jgi:ubiquinone/menaquinone biosynthesis C-methylase UbiE
MLVRLMVTGCSSGKKEFHPILGVELDPQRAQQAKESGYDQVYNCDAVKIPLPDNSMDLSVSNDMFVHILELEHKIAVLKEMERVLKPGGIFILNHPMSRAFGFKDYHVQEYFSFPEIISYMKLSFCE